MLRLAPLSAIFLLFYAARGVYLPAVPLYIEEVAESYYVVGLAAMASSAALAVSQYLWGVASDAVGRRWVTLTGLVLLMLVMAAMPRMRIALGMVVLRAVEGVAAAAVYTSTSAAVGDVAASLGVGFGYSLSLARLLGSTGFATASLLASGLVSRPEAAFTMAAVACGAALPPALMVHGKGSRRLKLALSRASGASTLLAATTAWSASFMAVANLWPNYMREVGYSVGDVYAYWALAAYGEAPFMALCGYLVDRGLLGEALATSAASLMLTYALYVWMPGPAPLLLAQVARSVAYAFFEVSTLAYAAGVGGSSRGALIGPRNAAMSIGWVAGAFYGGAVAEALGLRHMIISCMLLAPLMLSLRLPRSARPKHPAAEASAP